MSEIQPTTQSIASTSTPSRQLPPNGTTLVTLQRQPSSVSPSPGGLQHSRTQRRPRRPSTSEGRDNSDRAQALGTVSGRGGATPSRPSTSSGTGTGGSSHPPISGVGLSVGMGRPSLGGGSGGGGGAGIGRSVSGTRSGGHGGSIRGKPVMPVGGPLITLDTTPFAEGSLLASYKPAAAGAF